MFFFEYNFKFLPHLCITRKITIIVAKIANVAHKNTKYFSSCVKERQEKPLKLNKMVNCSVY